MWVVELKGRYINHIWIKWIANRGCFNFRYVSQFLKFTINPLDNIEEIARKTSLTFQHFSANIAPSSHLIFIRFNMMYVLLLKAQHVSIPQWWLADAFLFISGWKHHWCGKNNYQHTVNDWKNGVNTTEAVLCVQLKSYYIFAHRKTLDLRFFGIQKVNCYRIISGYNLHVGISLTHSLSTLTRMKLWHNNNN